MNATQPKETAMKTSLENAIQWVCVAGFAAIALTFALGLVGILVANGTF